MTLTHEKKTWEVGGTCSMSFDKMEDKNEKKDGVGEDRIRILF